MKQKFDYYGNHCLTDEDGQELTHYASYTSWVYYDGFVSVTDYYTGKGEAILTCDEFCKMAQADVGITPSFNTVL